MVAKLELIVQGFFSFLIGIDTRIWKVNQYSLFSCGHPDNYCENPPRRSVYLFVGPLYVSLIGWEVPKHARIEGF